MARRRTKFDMPFPMGGLVETFAYENQPRGSTVDCQNMRAYDPSTGRMRGAQRAGTAKYNSGRIADDQVQDIGHVVARDVPSSQAEVGARTVTAYAVTSGTVAKFTTSGFTTATNGGSALSGTPPVCFSAELFGVVYFADGTNEKKWTASTNTVAAWSASPGTLPTSGSNKPRLIETWRSRIVASGISGDPHNWFMSAVGDANNWDYSPTTTVATQAVAGNNTDAGKSADVINGMCPYSDDILIFFGDHSIHQMTGDPAEGGRIDRISDTIGGAWGRAWTKTPDGAVYFFGSRGGVYRMAPGSPPQDITQDGLRERFAKLNMNTILVRLAYNDREKGIHVFLTPLDGSATINYFYDIRGNSWWPDVFATAGQNPTSVHIYDGDSASDRTVLLGGHDGYIRKFDYTPSKNDDGVAISSYVWLGPIQLQNRPKIMLTEMKPSMATGTDGVTFNVYAAETAEAAKAGSSKFTGTWSAGRNKSERRRVAGHDIFIKLSNATVNQDWAYEFLGVELDSVTGPRERQW